MKYYILLCLALAYPGIYPISALNRNAMQKVYRNIAQIPEIPPREPIQRAVAQTFHHVRFADITQQIPDIPPRGPIQEAMVLERPAKRARMNPEPKVAKNTDMHSST